MTVIAGYATDSVIAIATDSRGTSDATCTDDMNKIIRRRNWACGVSWSAYVRDIIEECPQLSIDIFGIASVRVFRDALKAALIKSGAAHEATPGQTLQHPFGLLIAAPSGLFSVDCDYQIGTHRYYAMGSGRDVALGVLHNHHHYHYGRSTPDCIVREAVEAAKCHNVYCGGETRWEVFRPLVV